MDKSRAGNIDGSKGWLFDSHTWAVYNGVEFDVLFGQLGAVSHQFATETVDGKGRPSWTAGGITFHRAAKETSYHTKYTTDPANRSDFTW